MPLQVRKPSEITREFRDLLDVEHPEQKYQAFLEANTPLIPREFIQNHGLHFDLVLRKLALSRDYISDFFYLAKSSGDWNCVFVEIEKPWSKYFKPGTTELHPDFLTAIDQVERWRAWFLDPSNREGFINGTIKMLRVPPGLTANPCHLKYVLVMGRRVEFENNEIRRRLIAARERDDLHILSYDSLLEGLHAKSDLYVGIKRNDHVEIISNNFAGESMFVWMPSEQLRISQALKEDIERHRDRWYHSSSTKGGMVLDHVLPGIKIV